MRSLWWLHQGRRRPRWNCYFAAKIIWRAAWVWGSFLKRKSEFLIAGSKSVGFIQPKHIDNPRSMQWNNNTIIFENKADVNDLKFRGVRLHRIFRWNAQNRIFEVKGFGFILLHYNSSIKMLSSGGTVFFLNVPVGQMPLSLHCISSLVTKVRA